ncbi:MAG: hypothetical protein JXL81_03635, partial [Deltaproteobacteria bacterium]|nr:hypothetical protein [Deltaproteobacteria bacterium]
MSRKLFYILLILLFITACSKEDSSEIKQDVTQPSSEVKIRVLNPTPPNSMVDRVPLTPRLDTLEGKTIFLVDIGWGGKDAAPGIYKEMTAWFAQNMPSVKI